MRKQMKDFQQYYRTVVKSAQITGQKPSVYQYLLLRLADNISFVLLTMIMLLLASIGLLLQPKDPDGAKWALEAARLCLGVLLGLFAGRKRA
jgi:hypothetical protein